MHRDLLSLLRDPFTASELLCEAWEAEGGDVLEGVLIDTGSRRAYCITSGAAIMLRRSFPPFFLQKFASQISSVRSRYAGIQIEETDPAYYNFGDQWTIHQELNMTRTWGWDVEERYQMALLETLTPEEELRQSSYLDAGCGNGQLTFRIAQTARIVFGLDYSFSVLQSAANMRQQNLGWVVADLHHPPFPDNFFDLIFSGGVLHHTANTERAFSSVAPKVKDGGRFFIWLYRRPTQLFHNLYLYLLDGLRLFTQLFPGRSKRWLVYAYAHYLRLLKRLAGKGRGESFNDLLITAHDSITPRYRYYHTPIEVSLWYHNFGYGPVTITHWDDPHGFGVVATRTPIKDPPGINFGRAKVHKRFNK